jgi:hypothetical protein
MFCRVVWSKFTNVSAGLAASMLRAMIEAARTFQTLVNLHQTTKRKLLKGSHFYTRRNEKFMPLNRNVLLQFNT